MDVQSPASQYGHRRYYANVETGHGGLSSTSSPSKYGGLPWRRSFLAAIMTLSISWIWSGAHGQDANSPHDSVELYALRPFSEPLGGLQDSAPLLEKLMAIRSAWEIRVILGPEVSPREFPIPWWYFGESPDSGYCTAQQVGPQSILTAAHCIHPSGFSTTFGLAGERFTLRCEHLFPISERTDLAVCQLDKPVDYPSGFLSINSQQGFKHNGDY